MERWKHNVYRKVRLTVVVVVHAALVHQSHLAAHPPNAEHSQTTNPSDAFPRALILPMAEGPTPWTHKPLLNDPDRFHIAIMTDRTGGHRPGIWSQAVRRVNLLRPEFVMSVGDLIEGYTEDRAQVETEWKEFLGFIDQLEMKFFFVAGNHDVTNPVMHEIWREHFGPEWYSFDYKDVHFLCLSSEDPSTAIGEKQLTWIEEDLARHRDARWTLVFLHKPLWVYAERELAAGNPDPTGWKRVESLLGDRPHTVFAGHVHHYVQFDRQGTKYYQLATTGGSSQMRGIPYGEFDHIVWLTMEKDGPHATNLLLEGILPADVVTEQGIARFRDFLAKTRIEFAPILVDDAQGFSSGRIDLRVTNDFDSTVQVTGNIAGLPLRGLSLEPAQLELSSAPGETIEHTVAIQFGSKVAFQHLAQTVFTARLTTVGESPPLVAERTIPVVIDQRYAIPRAPTSILVDGNLKEWNELRLRPGADPTVVGPAESWTGDSDASMAFDVARDDQFVYFAARVVDDAVRPESDAVEVRLDARPATMRSINPRLGEGAYRFRLAAPDGTGSSSLRVRGYGRTSSRPDAKVVGRRSDVGYDMELAIPGEIIERQQGPDWSSIQLSIALVDVDEPGQAASRLLWRGTTDFDRRNTNFGHFVRTD